VFLDLRPSANYENVMIIWFCWESGITYLSNIFSFEGEHDRWAWVPDNGCSATLRYLQHRTYEFAHLLNVLFLETNDVRRDDVTGEISVQRRRTRICNVTLLITQCQFCIVGLCVWFRLKFSNG
jgi:hypothetical protein